MTGYEIIIELGKHCQEKDQVIDALREELASLALSNETLSERCGALKEENLKLKVEADRARGMICKQDGIFAEDQKTIKKLKEQISTCKGRKERIASCKQIDKERKKKNAIQRRYTALREAARVKLTVAQSNMLLGDFDSEQRSEVEKKKKKEMLKKKNKPKGD
jgi:hypothetical protein